MVLTVWKILLEAEQKEGDASVQVRNEIVIIRSIIHIKNFATLRGRNLVGVLRYIDEPRGRKDKINVIICA